MSAGTESLTEARPRRLTGWRRTWAYFVGRGPLSDASLHYAGTVLS